MSGVGAVALGAGLGLLFSNLLKPYTVPLLLVGLLAHAWGMFDKHRLEGAAASARPWWAEAAYWACWVALLALAAYVAFSYSRL